MTIGEEIPALDSLTKVSKGVKFVADLQAPNMLYVAVVRSTEPHAWIVNVDVSAVDNMRGIKAVITGKDFDAFGIEPFFGPVFRDQPILAIDRVRYVGEPVAAVAASDRYTAERAVRQIEVEYSPLDAVFTPDAAMSSNAPVIHPDNGVRAPGFADIIIQGQVGNICNEFRLRKGRGRDGFDEADHIFDHEFSSPSVQHVSMEPHATVAEFRGDRLIVKTCTQTPYAVRDELARIFDMPTSRVRVVVPAVGGGFGGKTYAKVEPLAAVMALKTGRPAKIVLSREEEFIANRKHQAHIRLRTGVRRDGVIVAREVNARFNAGAYADISPRLIKNGGYGAVGPYRIPHVHVDSYAVYTNLPSAGAFRGYGVSQGAWAYESQMDIIAEKLGIDSVELRSRNLLEEGDTFATGEALSDVRFNDVLTDAVKIKETRPRNGELSPHVQTGRGAAVIIKSTITPSTSQSIVKLDSDGSLQVLTSTVDMGQGSHTALAQIAAQGLGLGVDSVNIVGPDTDTTPYDLTTSSSRSTSAMGAAVGRAVDEVRDELLKLASEQFEVDVTDLEIRKGSVGVRGAPQLEKSIGSVVSASRRGSLSGQGYFMSDGGLDPKTGQGVASEHWHQGAVSVEVDVDTRTGKVSIRHLRASVYAGTVVSPVSARMQIQGSIQFGISQALYEQITNEEGYPTNSNLAEYTIAGMNDRPETLEISLLENDDVDQIHGLGETALPPVMPAIANAVYDATGVRIFDLPLTPERVLESINRKEKHG